MYYPNLAPGAPGYGVPYYQQPVYTPPVVTPAPQPVATGEEKFIVINGGKNAALSYPTAPNRTVFFLSEQMPFVYKKTLDQNGNIAEFKICKLVECETDDEGTTEAVQPSPVQQNEETPTEEYVTSDVFKTFSENMTKSMEALAASINELKKTNTYHYNKNQGKRGNDNAQSIDQ